MIGFFQGFGPITPFPSLIRLIFLCILRFPNATRGRFPAKGPLAPPSMGPGEKAWKVVHHSPPEFQPRALARKGPGRTHGAGEPRRSQSSDLDSSSYSRRIASIFC